MKFLLDTDHFSILQRKVGPEYIRLSMWMAQSSRSDFACSVVGFHEQVVGAHAFLNQAKNSAGLVRGYELLERLPRDYLAFALLPFDAASAAAYGFASKVDPAWRQAFQPVQITILGRTG